MEKLLEILESDMQFAAAVLDALSNLSLSADLLVSWCIILDLVRIHQLILKEIEKCFEQGLDFTQICQYL